MNETETIKEQHIAEGSAADEDYENTPLAAPAADYVPTAEELAHEAGAGGDGAVAPPPMDNADVEQDYAPLLVGKVPGKLTSARWYRKDGTTVLKIILGWETCGDMTSVKFNNIGGRLVPEQSSRPPGEKVEVWVTVRDVAEKSADGGMNKKERFDMDTLGKYYLAVVEKKFTGRNGFKFSDAKLAKIWAELSQEGYTSSSRDAVKNPYVASMLNRPMILGLSFEDGQVKGEDGLYKADPNAPKRQRVLVMGMGKGNG
jgi:hypothetical protein